MTRLDVLVGVDLGTSETKALVIGVDGAQLGFASRRTTWTRYPDGRSETTGGALLADVLATVGAALTDASVTAGAPTTARGLGIAGFAESGVVLDPSGDPVTPVIAWFDQRGAAELAATDRAFQAEFPRRTGLPVAPQWTFGKLLWMCSGGLALPPGSRWLNIPEYLAHALGAEQVSEPSLASRTGLLDQTSGQPWPDALALLGADPGSFLPPLVPAGHPAGRVRA
ncbi:MAG: carbohydrate kinase, partial [Pseudonocardia sp.]|nr:carbohydrate kinase [Pseudonocardia sp.]